MTDITNFYVQNGSIMGPGGQAFVPHGVDVEESSNMPSASTLNNDFPGINFVRLSVFDYADPSRLSDYVNSLTRSGMVVEIEDHNNGSGNTGGAGGQIFSGDQLNQELNWYSSIASAFKDNPNVWFGTNNEPSETDSSGNNDPAALSAWQRETYDAIRNTGNNNMVLLEANGWPVNGQPTVNQGYDASQYSSMTNVAWDVHYYGWLTGYSQDQGTTDAFLNGMVQQAQSITSADGTVPVIVGEFGPSTNGQTNDPNGYQAVQAVIDSGLGFAAWAWDNTSVGDSLTYGGNGLTDYGNQIANAIAAAQGSDGSTFDLSGNSNALGSSSMGFLAQNS